MQGLAVNFFRATRPGYLRSPQSLPYGVDAPTTRKEPCVMITKTDFAKLGFFPLTAGFDRAHSA